MSKAQVSIEFTILISIGFAIVAIIVILLNFIMEEQNTRKEYEQINDYGMSLQSEIILAAKVQPGYARTFTIPSDISGNTFTIEMHTGRASGFTLNSTHHQLYYATPDVEGALLPGLNTISTLPNGTIIISQP